MGLVKEGRYSDVQDGREMVAGLNLRIRRKHIKHEDKPKKKKISKINLNI